MDWIVVVPVKAAALGKSRLAAGLEPDVRAALVRAMALDTVAAAAGAAGVRRVLVVTPDAELGAALADLGGAVDLLPEPPADGTPALLAAIRSGVARARDVD